MTDLDLTQKDSFAFWTREIFRFADMDALQHLNNIASAVYCETARADFFQQKLGHDFSARINWMLANINITYLAPVSYPNEIMIGTSIKKIGQSSLTLQQGLFCEEGCFATAETVLVRADLETGKSVAFDETLLNIFNTFIADSKLSGASH